MKSTGIRKRRHIFAGTEYSGYLLPQCTGMSYPYLLWIKEVFKLSELRSLVQIHYPTDVNQEVLKQLPHVITGVNLFHFYFCVHIAVIQEVDVGYFDLKVEKIIHKE